MCCGGSLLRHFTQHLRCPQVVVVHREMWCVRLITNPTSQGNNLTLKQTVSLVFKMKDILASLGTILCAHNRFLNLPGVLW